MIVAEDTYDSLVDTIYGVIFGEATWDMFLGRWNEIVPGGKTTLFYHDPTRAEGASHIDKGFSDEWVESYSDHFASINPWAPAMSVMPMWRGFLSEELLPREAFVKTEFYNDFWKQCGETAIGMALVKRDGRMFNISSSIANGGPEDNRVYADTFTRLAPHLHRAVRYFEAGKGEKSADELGGRLFDAIGVGVLLVGDGGKLLSASAVGEQALSEGRSVRLDLQGKVWLADADANACLGRLLSQWRDGERQQVLDVNGVKLTLVRLQKSARIQFFDAPSIAIIIEPSAKPVAMDVPGLGGKFGLTRAEIKIMQGLLHGSSITDIAIESNRSRETIRSQLKSVFAKTGVNSQSELLRLVYFSEQARRNN
jgi:DNA-binding CsgD family transcriptional regulator